MLRFVASLLLACLIALGARGQEVRLALVIGQTEYSGDLSRVGQADYEAGLIEGALRSVGFDVTSRRDLSRADLRDELDDFRIRLEQAGREAVGFVYYTGHGAQHPGSQDSYLLGVDAKLRGASDLAVYGVDMKSQRDAFGATGAKAVFLVFDACRNTPAMPGWKLSYKGLSRVDAAADMLIAYSTGLGDLAAEGVYAPVLAEELKRPGQSAAAAFEAVQYRIAHSTGRDQLPWANNQLYRRVCFAECSERVEIGGHAQVERGRDANANLAAYLATVRFNGSVSTVAVLEHVLENYGMEALVALTGVGDGHARLLLGQSYESGIGNSQDKSKAAQYYRLSCDTEIMTGCFKLAVSYHFGEGVPIDVAEANRLYRRACDGGELSGCNNLAHNYVNGEGLTKNLGEAIRLFRYACDSGGMAGCVSLGSNYANGIGVVEDLSEANRLYRQACDRGSMLGCNNLGFSYDNGLGVAEDRWEAIRLYRTACEGGSGTGCYNLGINVELGRGGPKDITEANRLFRKACDKGVQSACEKL